MRVHDDYEPILNFLLDTGFVVEQCLRQNQNEEIPLCHAVANGSWEIVKILLERGGSEQLENCDGYLQSPIHLVRNLPTLKLMLEKGGTKQLCYVNNNHETILALSLHGLYVGSGSRNKDKRLALHLLEKGGSDQLFDKNHHHVHCDREETFDGEEPREDAEQIWYLIQQCSKDLELLEALLKCVQPLESCMEELRESIDECPDVLRGKLDVMITLIDFGIVTEETMSEILSEQMVEQVCQVMQSRRKKPAQSLAGAKRSRSESGQSDEEGEEPQRKK